MTHLHAYPWRLFNPLSGLPPAEHPHDGVAHPAALLGAVGRRRSTRRQRATPPHIQHQHLGGRGDTALHETRAPARHRVDTTWSQPALRTLWHRCPRNGDCGTNTSHHQWENVCIRIKSLKVNLHVEFVDTAVHLIITSALIESLPTRYGARKCLDTSKTTWTWNSLTPLSTKWHDIESPLTRECLDASKITENQLALEIRWHRCPRNSYSGALSSHHLSNTGLGSTWMSVNHLESTWTSSSLKPLSTKWHDMESPSIRKRLEASKINVQLKFSDTAANTNQ